MAQSTAHAVLQKATGLSAMSGALRSRSELGCRRS
jgi:hypothetical protein